MTNRLTDAVYKGFYDAIAGLMSIRVIDSLEIVDITEDYGKRMLIAPCPLDLFWNLFGEIATVVAAREGIRDGE